MYSIIVFTDRDIPIPHNELTDSSFLALNGFELEINEDKVADFSEIKTCHMCFVTLSPDTIVQPLWHISKYLFDNAPQYRDIVRFDKNEPDYVRHYNTVYI